MFPSISGGLAEAHPGKVVGNEGHWGHRQPGYRGGPGLERDKNAGEGLQSVGAGGKASTWINFSMSPPKSFWLYWELGRAWRLFWNFLCVYWAL